MALRNRRKIINSNKRKVFFALFFLLLFISVGYAYLSASLSINGQVVLKADSTISAGNLLQKLKNSGETCITKYEGQVTDQYDQTVTATNVYINRCEDKRNVIFANHCWQVVRTTETGGLKMVYNGEAENGKCLSTRGTHVGYAARTSQNLASNYWYGADYTYDSTNQLFQISGTTEQVTWNETTGPGLIGKYTCKSTSVDGTCSTLYLVDSYYNASNAYVIPLNFSSNYSQFGELQFNVSDNSPGYVGYMYNEVYSIQQKKLTSTETMLGSTSLSTNYWYANSVTWGSPTANNYNLDNQYQVSATTDYPNLVGNYTFRSATQSYTDTSVYYIVAVDGTRMYYFQLNNTGNHTLEDFNYTYTYGDSYTDNGNGTYTINNPTTINRSDWYTNFRNLNNKYVCKNATNNTCSELWYTTSTSYTSMSYVDISKKYKYAKDFTWDGSKYVLNNNTSVSFFEMTKSSNVIALRNAHYTCWNETGECATLSYIYYLLGASPSYINLTNGKSIEDAKNEMLYNNDVNTKNSIIKSGVDAWYKHYLLSTYDNYVEDTVFCDDRSQSNLSSNGWNPNGGNLSTNMYFYGLSDLSCPNDIDSFSLSNNKAKLTYKVGLMTYREAELFNSTNVRKTGQYYWLLSPNTVTPAAVAVFGIDITGIFRNYGTSNDVGVRPVISLKSEVSFSGGTGSEGDPWVVQ